jgi:hypothetical protein
MLNAFVEHVAHATNTPMNTARATLGIVLNASERQGSGLVAAIYERIPGARTLAAKMGSETGVATGVIARLIEQTPGGRQAVAEQMIRNLQKFGLGHAEIGAIFPAIGEFARTALAIDEAGHVGDMLGGQAGAAADAEVA